MLCIHDQTARTVMSRPPPSPTSCGRIRAFRASVLARASYLKTSYFALQMTLDTLGIVTYRQFFFWDDVGAKRGKGAGRENVQPKFENIANRLRKPWNFHAAKVCDSYGRYSLGFCFTRIMTTSTAPDFFLGLFRKIRGSWLRGHPKDELDKTQWRRRWLFLGGFPNFHICASHVYEVRRR